MIKYHKKEKCLYFLGTARSYQKHDGSRRISLRVYANMESYTDIDWVSTLGHRRDKVSTEIYLIRKPDFSGLFLYNPKYNKSFMASFNNFYSIERKK